MLPDGSRFVLPALLLGLGLAVAGRAWQRAIGLITSAVLLLAFGRLLPMWWPNAATMIVSSACIYLIRILAVAGIGIHLITTTSPTQLSAALRASRIPRAISVTLVVTLRFFPVVASEAAAVLDAMRLRGLAGTRGFLRHPIRSTERFIVPMIASSLRAGEDLSASAILRGLGSRHRPTAMIPPRFGRTDLVVIIIVVALIGTAQVVAVTLLPPLPT